MKQRPRRNSRQYWLVLTLGLTLIACSVYFALTSRWIKIETVQLDLAADSKEVLLFERIKTSLTPQFQHFAGKFFWEVPLTEVFDLVSKDKRVRKVSVYREFPSRLRIAVEPHTPVLAYLSGDGRFYPVAKDATLLPALPISEISDLAVIRGEELKDEIALREKALDLFEQIPLEGSMRKSNISEIVYSRKDGFRIFVSGTTAEVKMGDADFGPKISRVEKVISYLDSQNIKGRVIDARFSKKVVVRVRNNP